MMKRNIICVTLILAMLFSFSSFAFADSGENVNSQKGNIVNIAKPSLENLSPRAYWNIYKTVTINENGNKADAKITLSCLEDSSTASGYTIYGVNSSVTMSNKSGWASVESKGKVVSKSISVDKQSASLLIEYYARLKTDSASKTYQAYVTVYL